MKKMGLTVGLIAASMLGVGGYMMMNKNANKKVNKLLNDLME